MSSIHNSIIKLGCIYSWMNYHIINHEVVGREIHMALLRCCCRCSAVDFVPNFIFTILFAHSWLENLHKIELALYLNASMWLRWGPHLTFFASFKVRILNFFQCEEWGEVLNFFVRLRKKIISHFSSMLKDPKKLVFPSL